MIEKINRIFNNTVAHIAVVSDNKKKWKIYSLS